MVILDTNVISEIVRPVPHAGVLAWVDAIQEDELHTTSITKMELLYGVESLPSGKRKYDLEARYDRLFKTWFFGRTLPFDEVSAVHCARFAASAYKRGLDISTEDIQISAIAFQYRCPIVTRNTRDFDHEGLTVINPWEG